GLVEDRDPLAELLARDRERRADHDDVPVRHQIQAAIECGFCGARNGRERLARRVERHERLAGLAALDQLGPTEAAGAAPLADGRMLPREPLQRLAPDGPELGRVLDDALLL